MSSSVEPAPFDLARYQDPLTIQRVLLNAKTVAIVGLSSNELRASNFVGYYLKRHGYRVIPGQPARDGVARGEELREPPRPPRADRHRRRLPRARCAARDRRRGRRDRRRHALVSVRRDQRGGRPHRRSGRRDGGDGPLRQGRARALSRPHALARLQHAAHHLGARRAAVAATSQRVKGSSSPSATSTRSRAASARESGPEPQSRALRARAEWQPWHRSRCGGTGSTSRMR